MTEQHEKVFETQFADIGFTKMQGLHPANKMMFYKKMYVATVYMMRRPDNSYVMQVDVIRCDGNSVYTVIYDTQIFIYDDEEFEDYVEGEISDINAKIALQGDKQ